MDSPERFLAGIEGMAPSEARAETGRRGCGNRAGIAMKTGGLWGTEHDRKCSAGPIVRVSGLQPPGSSADRTWCEALEYATGVSADGWKIVGHGTDPSDTKEAWIAVLGEPGTSLLVMVGLVARVPTGQSRVEGASVLKTRETPTSRTSATAHVRSLLGFSPTRDNPSATSA
jgi:hypothetical protein